MTFSSAKRRRGETKRREQGGDRRGGVVAAAGQSAVAGTFLRQRTRQILPSEGIFGHRDGGRITSEGVAVEHAAVEQRAVFAKSARDDLVAVYFDRDVMMSRLRGLGGRAFLRLARVDRRAAPAGDDVAQAVAHAPFVEMIVPREDHRDLVREQHFAQAFVEKKPRTVGAR